MKNLVVSIMSIFLLPLIFVSCGGTDDSDNIANAFAREECEREENTVWNGIECFRPCKDNPCGSKGTCKAKDAKTYVCNCEKGYFSDGSKCVNPCDDDPCGGVTCKATGAETYECKCGDDLFWSGSKCVNPCDYNPCGSHGTCKATGAETYECICDNNYFSDGSRCQNPCDPNPCGHGSCKSTSAENYKCICDDNYFSNDTKCVNPCEDNPCGSHSTSCQSTGVETFSYISSPFSPSYHRPPSSKGRAKGARCAALKMRPRPTTLHNVCILHYNRQGLISQYQQ